MISLKAEGHKLRLSLDPSKLLTGRGLVFLLPLLRQTDILFLNEAELHDLFPEQKRGYAVQELHKLGIGHVFVKLGSQGAMYSYTAEDSGYVRSTILLCRLKLWIRQAQAMLLLLAYYTPYPVVGLQSRCCAWGLNWARGSSRGRCPDRAAASSPVK